MNRHFKTVLLVVIAVLFLLSAVLLAGCGSGSDPAPAPDEGQQDVPDEPVPDEPEPEPEPVPESNAEISEKAMQNFLDKIAGGDYVMDSEGYLKTTACSEDLVIFDYEDDSSYRDFAVMSVSGEVFQGFFKKDGIENITFLKEGSAIDAAVSKLPTYWLKEEVSDGNIYHLFYNDTEDPLRFVSFDYNVMNQVRGFAGYGDVAMNYMHEVYLVLDQENPTVAHLQAVVDDNETARYYFDDIDIVITFDDAQSDERAESWMKSPVYPDARTEWTETDIFIFDSVFLPGYGEESVPFMPFGSYALTIDGERFVTDDKVYIRDAHATQADMDSYIDILLQSGFEEASEEGETYYRRMIREETNCYSAISLEYDGGLNAVAYKYYDFPKYEGLDEINGIITENGYPGLPDTGDLTGFTAIDTRDEQTESWLYFYDYNTVLYVYADYADYDRVTAYLDGYAEELLDAGFVPVYVDDDGEDIAYYQSADGSGSFRYHFEDDGETVILLYKSEKCLTAEEVRAILAGEGFPEMDLAAYESGRDHTKFQKVMYGMDYGVAITPTMRFDTDEEGDQFLHQYTAALEEDGFLRVPGSEVHSRKTNGYLNEETGLGVAFDFYPGGDGADTYVYFEFKSGIEPEGEEDPMDNSGGFGEWLTEAVRQAGGPLSPYASEERAESAAEFLKSA